ncbi:hypothetical protein V8E52_008007 [Russula decolorans]
MSFQTPPYHYSCWAPASDWRQGYVILASNIDTIPSPPPRDQAAVIVDGLWGEHEWTLYPQPYCHKSPYLAWLRLPSNNASSDIVRSPVHKRMWQAHSNTPNVHFIDSSMFGDFKDKLVEAQAFEALDCLEKEFGPWRDFVEVVRGLQRSLLELIAFTDWWQDIQQGDGFQAPVRVPTRGSIFDDEGLYAGHACCSIAAYLILPNDRFILNPDKRVTLLPRNSSRMDVMSIQPLLHSLYVWYYPPHVRDVYSQFETAARGESWTSVRIRKPMRGCWAKKAKTIAAQFPGTSNNWELQRLHDEGPPPPWFLEHQSDLPGLTTEEWRSILGNTYWKSMWARPNPSDVGSSNFDPACFWIHGGPLFFGDKISAEVASGYDVASMDTADDDEVRQTVLYHLNMEHAVQEIEEMVCFQFPLDYEKQWSQGRRSATLTMTDMWGPTRDGGVIPRFFADKKAWRLWLHAAHEVIRDWEGFDDWDWAGFKDIRNMGINKLELHDFLFHHTSWLFSLPHALSSDTC